MISKHILRIVRVSFSFKRILGLIVKFVVGTIWNLGLICIFVGGTVGVFLYAAICVIFSLGMCLLLYISIREISDTDERENKLAGFESESFKDILRSY